MDEFYYFNNGTEERLFRKDASDAEKYMVCACAKNENDYIVEWVDHYLGMGFDKIIICDNNDDESLEGILKEYVENGTVEIFNCRGLDSFQVQFYSMFAREGNYKWCAYFDCDEFLELQTYWNIKDYLAEKDNEICISFNWLVYGSCGNMSKTDGGVQERFKTPVSPATLFSENSFIKSIVRGGDTFKNGCCFNGSHIPNTDNMFKHNIGGYFWDDSDSHQYFPPRYKEGYIKHYYTKSLEEWVRKANRGWPDGTVNLNISNYFICEDNAQMDINKIRKGLFCGEWDRNRFRQILDDFDVIQLGNPNKHIYAFLMGVYHMLSMDTNHTYVLTDSHIDDSTFNMLMEMAIKTGNRIVWANDHEGVWRSYLKYSKGRNSTYYILNFY